MKSTRMIALALATTAPLFFAACIPAQNLNGDDENQTSSVIGVVTDETGGPVQGGRVIAMERESNQKYSAQTNDDGSYLLLLPEGVYDLAFDDGQAYGTCFAGPVVLNGMSAVEQNAELPTDDDEDETIHGTIAHDSIADLSGWTVQFVSNVAGPDRERVLATVDVDAQGAFIASVGGELVMDIDVYDQDQNLVEFVDIAKLSGPCRLDFTVGTDTPNLYRHCQEVGDHLHAEEAAQKRLSSAKTNTAFDVSDFNQYDPDVGSIDHLTLQHGALGVNGGHLRVTGNSWTDDENDIRPAEILEEALCLHSRSSNEFDLEVKDDGSWWYDYKIHVYARGCGYLSHGENTFTCTDKTKDTYSLSVFESGWNWHTVNYNSHDPTIEKVDITACYCSSD